MKVLSVCFPYATITVWFVSVKLPNFYASSLYSSHKQPSTKDRNNLGRIAYLLGLGYGLD